MGASNDERKKFLIGMVTDRNKITRSAVSIIYSVVLLRGSLSTYLPIFGVTLRSFSLFGTVWLLPCMVHS